jgi:hypothetical protein
LVWEYLFSDKEVMPTKRKNSYEKQSPVVSNIYIAQFKKMALEMVKYKPSLWLQYVDNTFVV